jgi:hypothetical protein
VDKFMGSNVLTAAAGFEKRRTTRNWLVETLLGKMFSGASERRRQTLWHARVLETVRELGRRTSRLTIEVLTNDPVFNTIVSEADRIAAQSREEEKLQALLNAIQNCALPGAPTITVQTFFLRFLSEFTPAHLTVLEVLNNPREWLRSRSIGEDQFKFATLGFLIQYCLAAISIPVDSCDQIARNLQSRGLLQQLKFDAVMGRESLLSPRTTAMGRQFLAFIRKPSL